ncbi:pectinesterase family protein [Paenibacillus sp. P26]|nr:pectinesterase family protein [Paenibacillus sp. P26]
MKPGDWYAGIVGAAVKAGLTGGFSDGSFEPDAPVTREQAASMLAKVLKAAGKPAGADVSALRSFTDARLIAGPIREAAALMAETGIMTGTSVATFDPLKNLTRAQAAVVVKRFLQLDDAMLPAGGAVKAPVRYDALVDSGYTGPEGAAQDGFKRYKSVQSAVYDAPGGRTEPYVIFIKDGQYNEKITIDKPYLSLIGESRENTVLTFDLAADSKKPDGTTYGTFDSATVSVFAPHFTAENLTIKNGFDYNANAAKDAKDPTKMANAQAVALRTDRGSDQALFRNLNILGFQDTLYAQAGTQYYTNCLIAGNVDFIFGAGQAVFDDCDIVSLDRNSTTNNGYITAPSTPLSSAYGFLFIDSRIRKESPGMADHTVSLGRPWHPTTNLPDGTRAANPDAVGGVAYIRCYLDSHIRSEGWDAMSGKDKDGNKIWFYPKDSRFYEYGNTGPGAVANAGRKVLTDDEAKEYTITKVLGGWNPAAASRTE